MLVLSRHRGGQIVIADNIVVTVLSIERNKVRLGIEALKSIPVDRKEVRDRRVSQQDNEWSILNKIATDCPVS
jgi:carbon storage regulator